MKTLFIRSLFIVISIAVAGCVVNPLINPERDTPAFWQAYDKKTAELDQMAKDGKISWVAAATQRKEADKTLANKKSGYYTSWKFDSDDEEFHAYCIALAERLDRKQITFAQYDAARIAKFNQIRNRSSSQANQNELLQLQRNNQILLQQQQRQQQINQNRSIDCTTFGTTTTCR